MLKEDNENKGSSNVMNSNNEQHVSSVDLNGGNVTNQNANTNTMNEQIQA
jgi:hypothetical protein